MICGVTFDLEGTVIDLEWAHWQGHLEAAKEAGLILNQDRAISEIPCFVGGPDEKIAERIAELCNGKIDKAVILARSRYHFENLLASVDEVRPRDGFVDVVTSILRLGIPIAIGSLTDRILATRLIQKSGMNSLFSDKRIVLKEDVAELKPAPDIYLRTAEVLRIRPEEQLVFEDSVNGVRAAHSARSKVIGVPTLQSSDFICKLLQAGALRVFLSWKEINITNLIEDLDKI